MVYFGEKSRYENKESILFQNWDFYGSGAIFYETCGIPMNALGFVADQYNRFGVPIDHSICSLYSYGLELFKSCLDYYDPYVLFFDWSDVTLTDDWANRTYELLINDRYEEVDPEEIETYRYIPGQSDKFFNEYLSKPGMKALDSTLASSFEIFMEQELWGLPDSIAFTDCEGNYTDYSVLQANLRKFCTKDGLFRKNNYDAYFDLSLWAGILWMMGPLSTNYRMEANDITYEAIKSGQEVILYGGTVYGPKYYRAVNRDPKSCYKCGVSGWCVESVLDDEGVFRSMCEGCLTRGMKRFDGATCGTKFCRYWECPHNINYQNAMGGLGAMRTGGQLGTKAMEAKRLLGGDVKRKVIG